MAEIWHWLAREKWVFWLAFLVSTLIIVTLLMRLRAFAQRGPLLARQGVAITSNVAAVLGTLLSSLCRPAIWLVAIGLSTEWLRGADFHQPWFHKILIFGFLLQGIIWVNALVDFYIGKYVAGRIDDTTAGATAMYVMGFTAKLVMIVLVLLVALEELGVNVTALVTGLGIGGVAIALAVQNVLGDLLASLSIVLDKPFVVGDFLDVDGLAGTVEKVGLKTTRVRSLSGELLVFPNGSLLSSRIRNYQRMQERRVVLTISVIYETKLDHLKKISGWLKDAVTGVANTRFDRAHLHLFGSSSIDYEVVFYVPSPDYQVFMDMKQQVLFAIFSRFSAEGIEFAYPTQKLYLSGGSDTSTKGQSPRDLS